MFSGDIEMDISISISYKFEFELHCTLGLVFVSLVDWSEEGDAGQDQQQGE